MSNNKFRLKPLHAFVATIIFVVFVVILYDVSTRRSTIVVDVQEKAEIKLEDMTLGQLQQKFDSIQIATNRFRPSTMIALNERIAIARMMLEKSTTPEEEAIARTSLMQALGTTYVMLRNNGAKFGEIRDELVSVIERVGAENTGDERRIPLLLGLEIATHQIADGTASAETLVKTQQACDALKNEFLDVDTAMEIEKFLLPLTVKSGLGPEVDEVIGQVSAIYRDHPDKKLQNWSYKLSDDLVFRKLKLFEIYEGVMTARQGAAQEFRTILEEVLKQSLSPVGFERLIGFCRDLDSRDEYEVSLESYRRIEQHLSQPELIEQNRENIVDCQNGIKRIESLGKPIHGTFVDALGKTVDLDGEEFKNDAVIVFAVHSAAEFSPIFKADINVSGLKSFNIRLVVLCVGMDAASVTREFGEVLDEDIFVVPDPDLNSVFYAACPTETTPTYWVISRDHKLIDFEVLSFQLPSVIEELRFTR